MLICPTISQMLPLQQRWLVVRTSHHSIHLRQQPAAQDRPISRTSDQYTVRKAVGISLTEVLDRRSNSGNSSPEDAADAAAEASAPEAAAAAAAASELQYLWYSQPSQ